MENILDQLRPGQAGSAEPKGTRLGTLEEVVARLLDNGYKPRSEKDDGTARTQDEIAATVLRSAGKAANRMGFKLKRWEDIEGIHGDAGQVFVYQVPNGDRDAAVQS